MTEFGTWRVPRTCDGFACDCVPSGQSKNAKLSAESTQTRVEYFEDFLQSLSMLCAKTFGLSNTGEELDFATLVITRR